MKVKDAMTPNARAVCLNSSLAEAAREMWENDCGALPVIKDDNKVVGMITDRDICMASAIRDRTPSRISVAEVMGTKQIFSVTPDDEVSHALELMREHQIRRLPIVNIEGELEGILSMNDVVLRAKARNGKRPEIEFADVVKTYQAICAHPVPMTLPAAV